VDQLAGKEKMTMMPFERCAVCGGELVEKEVEKLLRGGMHTAILPVWAEVCLPGQSFLVISGGVAQAGEHEAPHPSRA
jgi:hypothetical protein